MGNCLDRCFGRMRKRKYLRTRYNIERDISIEFENLMDEEQQNEETMAKAVSTREKQLLRDLRFEELVQEQRRIDKEIDSELIRQEEELRMEEEAYYEAKREAARVAKMQKQQAFAAKQHMVPGQKEWLQDEDGEWNVAGGEDDFEMFLENVKARSLAARTRALPSQVPIDVQSTSSDQTKEQTEASSLDLEWEAEAGLESIANKGKRHRKDENHLAELCVKHLRNERQDSNELEWEQDVQDTLSSPGADSESTRLLGDGGQKGLSDEEYTDR